MSTARIWRSRCHDRDPFDATKLVVVGGNAVLGAAVVPDGHVPVGPSVTALQVRLLRDFEEQLQQCVALRHGQLDDPRGEVPVDVEDRPSGTGVITNHWMNGRGVAVRRHVLGRQAPEHRAHAI